MEKVCLTQDQYAYSRDNIMQLRCAKTLLSESFSLSVSHLWSFRMVLLRPAHFIKLRSEMKFRFGPCSPLLDAGSCYSCTIFCSPSGLRKGSSLRDDKRHVLQQADFFLSFCHNDYSRVHGKEPCSKFDWCERNQRLEVNLASNVILNGKCRHVK